MEAIDQNGVEVFMLTPHEVQARIDAGTAYVVDVREPNEHTEARIANATLKSIIHVRCRENSTAGRAGTNLALPQCAPVWHCRRAPDCDRL